MTKGTEKKHGDLEKGASRAVSMYQSQMREYEDRRKKKVEHYKQTSQNAFEAGREKYKLENLSGAKRRLAWEMDGE